MTRLPDLVRLVGLEPVQRVAVLVREDRHGTDPEFVRGPEGPDGDFAAIGDQNLAEHQGRLPGSAYGQVVARYGIAGQKR